MAGGNRWETERKHTLDEAWLYLPDQDRWEPLARLPRPFAFGVFGVRDGTLILLGGDDGATTRQDGFALRRDRQAHSFPAATASFAYAGGAIVDGPLHILGGADDAPAIAATRTRAPRRSAHGPVRGWTPR